AISRPKAFAALIRLPIITSSPTRSTSPRITGPSKLCGLFCEIVNLLMSFFFVFLVDCLSGLIEAGAQDEPDGRMMKLDSIAMLFRGVPIGVKSKKAVWRMDC